MTSPSLGHLRDANVTTPTRRAWGAFAALALGVFVADQASKWAAIAHLTDAMGALGPSAGLGEGLERFLWASHPSRRGVITVVSNFFHLRYVENPGAAWGFLSASAAAWRTPFFLTVSVAAMAFILLHFRQSRADQRGMRVALAMVFGGAVGNFVDRARLGYVIDFIDWHLGDTFTWPTFNVADAAISIGVIVLLLGIYADSGGRGRPARLSL